MRKARRSAGNEKVLHAPRQQTSVRHAVRTVGKLVEPAFATSGQHKLNSIFATVGPGIRPGSTVNQGQVLDLAPTLLYMLGLSVPQDMDGRVLTEVFERPFVDQYPVTYSEPTGKHHIDREGFSAEEEELIRERLQDLGYLA